jgi:hypothetical protein
MPNSRYEVNIEKPVTSIVVELLVAALNLTCQFLHRRFLSPRRSLLPKYGIELQVKSLLNATASRDNVMSNCGLEGLPRPIADIACGQIFSKGVDIFHKQL